VWAITALLLVIGLVLVDWWQAKREMDHLLFAATVSEGVIVSDRDAVVLSLKTNFGDANLSHVSLDTAKSEIAAVCSKAAADTQDNGAQVSEVFVLPWHRSIGEALDAYLAHSKAWQNKFAACAHDPTRLSDGSTTAQINGTLRVAHRAFTNALPFAAGSDRGRVETLFKD